MADVSAGILPKRRDSTATATHTHNTNHNKINTHTTPGAHCQAGMSVTRDELNKHRGMLATMAVSAAGSSFLQACLRAFPGEALPLVRAELMPRFRELANDDHGVYCLRLVLESSRETFMSTLHGEDATDDAFWCGLCTKSLHTRRFIQFVLEQLGDSAYQRLCRALNSGFRSVVRHKEGCIAAQRILDGASQPVLVSILQNCAADLVPLATDPHARYVVGYLVGRVSDSSLVREALAPTLSDPQTVRAIACDRFGSSCFEMLLNRQPFNVCPLLSSAFDAMSDNELIGLANDAFGNYVVQCFVNASPSDESQGARKRLALHAARLSFGTKILRAPAGAHAVEDDSSTRSRRSAIGHVCESSPAPSSARPSHVTPSALPSSTIASASSKENPFSSNSNQTGSGSGGEDKTDDSASDERGAAPSGADGSRDVRQNVASQRADGGTGSASSSGMPMMTTGVHGHFMQPPFGLPGHDFHVHHAFPQYGYPPASLASPMVGPGPTAPSAFTDPNMPYGGFWPWGMPQYGSPFAAHHNMGQLPMHNVGVPQPAYGAPSHLHQNNFYYPYSATTAAAPSDAARPNSVVHVTYHVYHTAAGPSA